MVLLKVGELAARFGVTVRALHHYDQIGLVSPSARSAAGYRLYNADDIHRLHKVQLLRQLGLALGEIAQYLAEPDKSAQTLIDRHIQVLDQQIERSVLLRDRLQSLRDDLVGGNDPAADDWLAAAEMMLAYDKYFSRAELDRLPLYRAAREYEWAALVNEAQALMSDGIAPNDERAQTLSIQWMKMLERDTAGDPRLLERVDRMHASEPSMRSSIGASAEMRDYMLVAFAESRIRIFERYLKVEEAHFLRANYAKQILAWPALMSRVRDAAESNESPASETARALATEWLELFRGFAGEEPSTLARFREAMTREPELTLGTWMDAASRTFLSAAVKATTL
nr:MerR family transcriptional regulator [Paraburkholderia dioscoreae]